MESVWTQVVSAILDGKIGGIGAFGLLLLLVISVVRLATKLEVSARELVEAVKKLGTDLHASREEDRKEHQTTREKVDVVHKRVENLEITVLKAVEQDGTQTRQSIGDQRLEAIKEAVEEAVTGQPSERFARKSTAGGRR